MNKASIKKVIQYRFVQLDRHYSGIKRSMDQEAIHEFRVEYKMLRAFLRLLQYGRYVRLKMPKGLKQFYMKSGQVRELQLILAEPGELRKVTSFDSCQLKLKLRTATRELEKHFHPHLLLEAEQKIENRIPEELEDRSVKKFFRERPEDAQLLFSKPGITDEQMHDVRKILKDLLYNARMLEKETDFEIPSDFWNRRKEEYYVWVAHALGDYHDVVVRTQQATVLQGRENLQLLKWKRKLVNNMKSDLFLKHPLSPVQKTRVDSG